MCTSGRTYGLRIAAAISRVAGHADRPCRCRGRGWRRPPRRRRRRARRGVAVCRQWVSWSVAKPSVMSPATRACRAPGRPRGSGSAPSPTPMTAHCSAVDSSMLRKLVTVLMVRQATPRTHAVPTSAPVQVQLGEDVAGGEVAVAQPGAVGHGAAEAEGGEHVDGREQVAQLARRREVLVLLGDAHLLDAVARARGGRSRPRPAPRAPTRRR